VNLPGPREWRFDEIAADDVERARLLEAGVRSDELMNAIAAAIRDAVAHRTAKFGIDTKNDQPRAIIQVRVGLNLYDQFFNSRTGYRAHYWSSPDEGNSFDETLICHLRQALSDHIPISVEGCNVIVKFPNEIREEWGGGPCQVTRDFALQSFQPEASKAWICEWLITDGRDLNQRQQLGLLNPKLIIKRWSEDGLRAPCGEWLDFKGGFVDSSGNATPSKKRTDRASEIHETGWT
jgi:hypothetical protein